MPCSVYSALGGDIESSSLSRRLFFALLLLPSGFQEASVARVFFSKDQSIQKLSSYFVFSMQDTRRAYKLYAVEPAVKKER